LHFWFATFDGLRREMFPRLVAAYATRVMRSGIPSRDGVVGAAIAAAAAAGGEHFAALATRLLEMDESAIEALSHEVGTFAL
jgi:hypothetical protein